MKRALSHPFALAGIIVLFVAAIMAVFDLWIISGGNFWAQFEQERQTVNYFCEETTPTALFRHKVNTYTNLIYLWAGIWMTILGYRDRQKGGSTYLRRHPEWSFLMAWACFLLFCGSTLFHAGLTIWTEWADLAGVYAVTLSFTCLNFHRVQGLIQRKRTSSWPFILLWVILWVLACASIFQIRSWYLVLGSFMIIALGGIVILRLTSTKNSSWFFLVSMFFAALGVMFFSFDISRIGCDPKAWIQPHGNWHLSVGISFMIYYQFVRSSTAQHAAL